MATILIVDDEETMCDSCKQVLSRDGHEVDAVLSGDEALDRLDKKHYEVVITDLRMPGIDGMELLRRLKEKEPNLDVIMITAYSTVSTATEAAQLEVYDYIPKPFEPEELRNAVRRTLGRRALKLKAEMPAQEAAAIVGQYKIPPSLYYHQGHSWARVEEQGTVTVGSDDYLQKTAGDIIYVFAAPEGKQLPQGDVVARLITKQEHIVKLPAPVGGEVIQVNTRLEKDHDLVNKDPFGEGWVLKLQPSDLARDLKSLFHGEELTRWWIQQEVSRKRTGPYTMVSTLDRRFKYQIAEEPGGENFKACFACGACTAGCPVRAINEKYNPRKIIRMALLGMKERVLSSEFIWLCSTCYTCQERCPQDVKLTEVMNAIKNIAVREGYVHPSFTAQIDALKANGRLYEIADFDNKKRAKLGLPEIYQSSEEISKILILTGVDRSTEP